MLEVIIPFECVCVCVHVCVCLCVSEWDHVLMPDVPVFIIFNSKYSLYICGPAVFLFIIDQLAVTLRQLLESLKALKALKALNAPLLFSLPEFMSHPYTLIRLYCQYYC